MSDQDLEEQLRRVARPLPRGEGGLVPLLQGAQAIFGWLPPEVMARVAEAADEPLSKALGVATFYSQFRLKPHAKNTVRCCHGTACHVSGAPLISQEIEKHLGCTPGENTDDMLFTHRRGALRGRVRHGARGDDQRSRPRQADAGQGRAVVKEFREAEAGGRATRRRRQWGRRGTPTLRRRAQLRERGIMTVAGALLRPAPQRPPHHPRRRHPHLSGHGRGGGGQPRGAEGLRGEVSPDRGPGRHPPP